MHLLAAQQVGLDQAHEPVDLGQSPAECVILSSADSELACFARAHRQSGDLSLRLANLKYLAHPFSVDLYIEKTLNSTKIAIVRLLGGKSYWSYGCEQLANWAQKHQRCLVFLPGDTAPDEELRRLSSIRDDRYDRLWEYCLHGGVENARITLTACGQILAGNNTLPEAKPLEKCGLYLAKSKTTAPLTAAQEHFPRTLPYRAMLVFYRALIQAADTAVIDALILGYHAQGIQLIPAFASSLKSPDIAAAIRILMQNLKPDLILNTMGFALSKPGESLENTAFGGVTVPIQQILFASLSENDWRDSSQGLGAHDLAMQVALPEMDGKILSRAVSFKGVILDAPWAEYQVIGHRPNSGRIAFCADLSARWIKLAHKPNPEKHVAVILAHYPNKNARMGNGVGLDTPASVMGLIEELRRAGYDLPETLPFNDGDGLIRYLQAGVNTVDPKKGEVREHINLEEYLDFFAQLPQTIQNNINQRWGDAKSDPFFRAEDNAFGLG
ncbi:MAG: cobaltochelatase subunit CobN, partial [Alphaproteobacteria bacterium]|nr:cobaltochelatase subunit CobN [Alphaproteobacteria bacterium]